jgi:peptidoglycan/xylan/chitin deacetylase (PgdA/CDA1 family)
MWTATLVQQITGAWPVYMRPPRGELDDRVLRIIKSVGMIPVMWTTDTQDWRINLGYSYDQSLAELMTGFNIVSNRGVISLHHDIVSNFSFLLILFLICCRIVGPCSSNVQSCYTQDQIFEY